MKLLTTLLLCSACLIGCTNPWSSEGREKFAVAHNGRDVVIYCQDGFLIRESYYSGQEVINNDAGYPTRCSADTKVLVKETAKTGVLVGSVN